LCDVPQFENNGDIGKKDFGERKKNFCLWSLKEANARHPNSMGERVCEPIR